MTNSSASTDRQGLCSSGLFAGKRYLAPSTRISKGKQIMGYRTSILIAGTLTMAMMAGLNQSSAALIVNGDFEAPVVGGGFQTLGFADGGPLSSFKWTIAAGTTVDLIRTHWTPYEQTQSLDLNGNGPATISQTFATVASQAYLLTFAYSNNPDNGVPPNVTPTALVTVNGERLAFQRHD